MSQSKSNYVNPAAVLLIATVWFMLGLAFTRYYQGTITIYTECDIIYMNTFNKTVTTETGLKRRVAGERGAKELVEKLTVACVNDEYDQVSHYLMNYANQR
jgi:hypothetical protein